MKKYLQDCDDTATAYEDIAPHMEISKPPTPTWPEHCSSPSPAANSSLTKLSNCFAPGKNV